MCCKISLVLCGEKKRRQTPTTRTMETMRKYYTLLNVLLYVILAPKDLFFLLSKSVWPSHLYMHGMNVSIVCVKRPCSLSLTYKSKVSFDYLLLWLDVSRILYTYTQERNLNQHTSQRMYDNKPRCLLSKAECECIGLRIVRTQNSKKRKKEDNNNKIIRINNSNDDSS